MDDFYYRDYEGIVSIAPATIVGGDIAIRRPSEYFLDSCKGKTNTASIIDPITPKTIDI